MRKLAESQVSRDGKKDDEYENAVQDALVIPMLHHLLCNLHEHHACLLACSTHSSWPATTG